ncbi:ATP-binding protein [Thermocoleostomius sinensis]|uniref:Circadian input-output histidine kinase CikA n=1 Tax=Thermocoleostomius sinensis A174 TaxID=2016057 RepID=A0A9E9C5Q1_9CYAN|nr:ATP-binding protein [Thermocoleostomius sinensis]WAL61396.1 ATP-binding protein [Thermocoleostomius sinensis A174]
MTLPSDRSSSTTEPTHSAASCRFDSLLSASGADLVLTQDTAGRCLSFYWNAAERYNLCLDQVIGKPVDQGFSPVSAESYVQQVQQVLESLVPVSFEYPFTYTNQYFAFDLTISPILTPYGAAKLVVVTGKFLCNVSESRALELVDRLLKSDSSHHFRYQKRLNQVIWNIRRSLDLESIWQQTVNGLGEALEVDRCLICPYKPDEPVLKVLAEYRHPSLPSMLGTEFSLETATRLRQALTTLRPVPIDFDGLGVDVSSGLAIPTTYKDQPNGLIILHQPEQLRRWNDVEIELLQEIAQQVGAGVTYVTLLEETRSLAAELQRANENLRQQHKELEEARRQAEAASRLKSEFLANTSHELRTPLNGMIGFLKLIMDGMADDPEEQNQFIQEAYRSAIHLLNIINDILDIAKIEAGKMQLDLNPIELDDLLTDVENFTRPQAQQKNLSFEILTPATRDEVVIYGNYQRLLQVMLNLVGNAIKFTHEGGITISAEVIPGKVVVQGEEKPGTVKISVADTGIGVSLEKQDKLFQTFSQVDGSRTRQYGGTGLGLAISQKLVEAMGGVVNFFSMGEGLGSTVTFTVPLYQDPVMITSPIADSVDLLM